MLLSDLAGKEIINLFDGEKLGFVGDADMIISPTGAIESLILSPRASFSGFWSKNGGQRERGGHVIPWQSIKKIGSEVIIVDVHNEFESMNKYSI